MYWELLECGFIGEREVEVGKGVAGKESLLW